METPLLAGNDNVGLSSSTEPPIEEESEFSRLIALSNPLSALAEEFDFTTEDIDNADVPNPIAYRRRPIMTILGGFFCLAHVGCIWGAYTATAWSETHLHVILAWQQAHIPVLNDFTDKIVQTSTLATILEALGEAGSYGFLALLWITALLMPCAYMILSPTFVASDHKRVVDWNRRMRKINGRRLTEISMRFALVSLFSWMLVDLEVSLLEVEWTGTLIRIQNRALGALGAFAVGVCSAILVAVILRWPPSASDRTRDKVSPSRRFTPSIASPPPQAFNHPTISDSPPMMALEETADLLTPETSTPARSRAVQHSEPSTPDLRTEADETNNSAQPENKTSFLQRVLVFQLGVLALILWLPSMYLPILSVSYSGNAVEFLKTQRLQAFLWDVPITVSQRAAQSGTAPWILGVLATLYFGTLVVLPLFASCLSALVWLGDESWSTPSKRALFAMQPGMGGVVFSAALWGTVREVFPSLPVHQHICSVLQLSSEACLSAHSVILPGAWFYLLHSVVLEIYVMLTLKWT